MANNAVQKILSAKLSVALAALRKANRIKWNEETKSTTVQFSTQQENDNNIFLFLAS